MAKKCELGLPLFSARRKKWKSPYLTTFFNPIK
ncbi:hypothetical protein PG1604B_1448 [Bifidobacterium pseudolongum subsp. pseudolongum]|nr:hypothetical protein PG1604B_1448 [Bifidobacterium pseudolongum subsp. pseudolongum]